MVSSVDHGPLSRLPGYMLRRAAHAMMAELAPRLAILDLRISDATVILFIGEQTDLTSSDIGKAIEIQRANMVPVLNRLEAAGLIERRPIDRKSLAIVLTEAGIARRDAVRDLTDRFEQELLDRIPEEHRPHFIPALKSLIP